MNVLLSSFWACGPLGCSTSAVIPHGSQKGLRMKTEMLLLPEREALASRPFEVSSVGMGPEKPRKPHRDQTGRGASGPLLLVCIWVRPVASNVPISLCWKPLARKAAAFLCCPGYPSYASGLPTSWPVILKGNFSFIMMETLWCETCRHFFNLEVLRQLRARDWWGWKYRILIFQKHLSITYLWPVCNQN